MLNVLPPQPYRKNKLRSMFLLMALIVCMAVTVGWILLFVDIKQRAKLKNEILEVERADSLVQLKPVIDKYDAMELLKQKQAVEDFNKNSSRYVDYFFSMSKGLILENLGLRDGVLHVDLELSNKVLLLRLFDDLDRLGAIKIKLGKIKQDEEGSKKYRVTLSAVFPSHIS